MTSLPELKNTFIDNLNKVAIKLGKNIHSISRDKYLEVVRELNLPRLDLFSLGGYRNLVNQISENSVAEIVPDYSSMFKNSLLEVSNILEKHVMYITRDEYVEIGKHNNTEFLSKHRLQELGGFTLLKNTLFKDDISKETNKANILLEFKNYVTQNKEIPTLKEVRSMGKIKGIFDSIEDVEEAAKEAYPEINDYIFNESSFTPEYRKALEQEMKKYKRFVVTTAVSGKKADDRFLSSIKNYADRNNAMVLIMPCEDVFSRKKTHSWNLDPSLKQFKIVFNDLYLNKNICLCTIKTSAKMIQPLTGLDRLLQKKNASIVIASTKQFLKYIPNSPEKLPHALMTTGAITIADYNTDYYMCKRLSTIAENDHLLGALVFEIQDDTIFHFRQLQGSTTGSISDLGEEYHPNGSISKCFDTVLTFGDSHVGQHDKQLTNSICTLVPDMNCSTVVLHDILNATSISHHDIGKIAIKSAKANRGESSLEKEGKLVKEYLDDISSRVKEVIVVKSNHDTHLDKFLIEGRFFQDPINFYFSLDLVKKLIEGVDPLKYMMEEKIGLKNKNIKWLEIDESFKKYGVEFGVHGHNGANGSRGSALTFEKGIGNVVTAHTHGAFIFRSVFGVGTSTLMKMGYNTGLSSWTRTCALTYNNGTRQLINFIPYKNSYRYKI